MSVSNKDISLSIINFLRTAVAEKQIAEDFADSIDVAIDCIADAFEVNKDDDSKVLESKFKGKSLSDLVKGSLESSPSGSSAAPAAASKEIDAETKAKADQLKVEGNRAMAAKQFPEAIAKYTEAIELDSTNVVYLSNRAAAHSSSAQHEKAVEDAEKAITLDPSFSKAYSRLGLARYALGDAKGAMDAYKKGLDVEGDGKSDAMKRGYETAKRRVEEELESSIPQNDVASTSNSENSNEQSARGAGAGAGAGGMPDFSSMFGGGAGGMPNFSELMNNPQIMQAAQQMMQNPGALQGLMNNPSIRQMAQSMGLGGNAGGEQGEQGGEQGGQGGGPDLSELLNNPMLQNLASQFGGAGARGGNNGSNGN